MYKQCIICQKENASRKIILNNLAMKKCDNCGLIWRRNFDIPIEYYEEKNINLTFDKIEQRTLNCIDRINIFKKFANLNNLCDIGAGEGLFLKVLKDNNYKNLIGIEPSGKISDFAKNNDVNIQKGTINNAINVIVKNNIHTVTMLHLIEHLKDPLGALQNICKILQPKDFIIIETPDIDAFSFKKMYFKHKLIYPEHLFYFNMNNLKKILKKAGFKIITFGKRDFGENNLSIKECLWRLGLLKKICGVVKKGADVDIFNKRTEARIGNVKVRGIIRWLLNKIVKITGRLNYIWVIAQK